MAANLLTIKYIEMRKILLCLGVVFGFVGIGFGQDFEWAKSMGGVRLMLVDVSKLMP